MVNAYSHSTFAGKPAYPARAPGCTGAPRADAPRAGGQRGCNLFLRDFEVCNRYATASPRPAGRLPGRLRARRKDQMTAPRQAAELAAALRARVTTVDAGHALMEEAPDGAGCLRARCPPATQPTGATARPLMTARRAAGASRLSASRHSARDHLLQGQSAKPTRCQNARNDGVG
jgi:hypothetical protein